MSARAAVTEPRTYRKRPVTVQAMRWPDPRGLTALDFNPAAVFVGANNLDTKDWPNLRVRTLHGWAVVKPGDWIVKGDRDCWPCDHDQFMETYARADEQTHDEPLTFARMSLTNRARCDRWHHEDEYEPWSGSDWACAMCGEAGEAANIVKKLRRHETRRAMGPSMSLEHPAGDRDRLLYKLGEELADTILYADLLAAHYGINLPAALINKFNIVSERQGFPERL